MVAIWQYFERSAKIETKLYCVEYSIDLFDVVDISQLIAENFG